MHAPVRRAPRALVLLLTASAQAQTLFVDADAPAGGTGSSWADAFDDLQPALQGARTDPSVREVWIAEGRYLPSQSGDPTVSFLVRDGLRVLGGFDGTELVAEARRPAQHLTVLDGDLLGDDGPGFANYADNSRTVVVMEEVGAGTVLDGLTVRGGSGNGAIVVGGSGLRLLNATPTLRGLVVRDNVSPAQDGGGGIWAKGGRGVLSLERCTFARNSAIAGASVRIENLELEVQDCLFEANTGIDGGGVFAETSVVRVARSLFQGNQLTSGAGLTADRSRFTVEDSQFLSNTGTGGVGISSVDSDLTVRRCHFEGNRATSGAGIDMFSSYGDEVMLVEDCSFVGNRACSGAGIHAGLYPGAVVEVRRCYFDDNRMPSGCGFGRGGTGLAASGNAGHPMGPGSILLEDCVFLHNRRGQFLATSEASFVMRRCTFADARSNGVLPEPAMVTTDGSGRLEHSILWGNDPQQVQGLANVSVAWSDVRNGGTTVPGPGNLQVDPAFVDAANGDVHLAPGSDCIDAGDPSLGAVATDFEGDPRYLDGNLDGVLALDLGADEVTPLRLDVTGASVPGGSLAIDATGAAGLACVLGVGPPGAAFLPRVGVLLLDPTAARYRVLGSSPASVQVNVPAGVPTGVPFVLQAFGANVLARVLTNPVRLSF